jgi:transposase
MYCGIDLHSNNNYVAIQDESHRDVVCRRLGNDLGKVLGFLEPYRDELEGIAVESTYNWYWLVDGLMEAGYDVRLVNTTKASNYHGLKYTDDRHDARWIAHLLVLGILPEGYIMPRQERGLRDLLRRRSFMVQKHTSMVIAIRTVVTRSTGKQIKAEDIKKWDVETIQGVVGDEAVTESITSLIRASRAVKREVKTIERSVLNRGKLRDEFHLLTTTPGIGKVIALTIMCETGDINRFPEVGNYGSYCRCVTSERTSNSKKKGIGNRKNGNKYLSWAYSEAAHHAPRFEPLAKRYFERKRKRSHIMVARRALANKIARGCYYVLRDQVPFDPSRTFG